MRTRWRGRQRAAHVSCLLCLQQSPFASCCGTAPIVVSSANRIVHRLSRRGNRRLNSAIHMAALS